MRVGEGLIALGALMTGCAAQIGGPPIDTEGRPIRSGTGHDTGERPEVGQIVLNGYACTATVVAPRVLLTAAHCVEHRSGPEDGWFYVADGSGAIVAGGPAAPIVESRSFGGWLGEHDLALLRLGADIPGGTPIAPIASAEPRDGERVRAYGFGRDGGGWECSWGATGRRQKRVAEIEWPIWLLDSYGCPGDSGGPSFNGAGEIVAVTSSGNPFGTFSTAGLPVRRRGELSTQIAAWSGGGGSAGEESHPPAGDPAAPACGDGACNGDEACGSCETDCGACGPWCGDGACNGDEACGSCETDCGACGPWCGDGACNGDEDCWTCDTDCGECW
jgi:hypothetical protein